MRFKQVNMKTTRMHERIKTGGLCHVAIDVSDLDHSIQFYMSMFDMEIVSRSDRIVHLKTAGAKDSFFLFRADGPVNPTGCGLKHFHFGFVIDDANFDRAMDYIKQNNIKVHHNPNRTPGRFVYIEDPDGYVIQLEPGDCGG
jgi:catechol 2,3-dioxygenase-like lactoylglutathione lyase family enzyme